MVRQLGAGHWENGYIESFNGKLRDELLDREIFYTLGEAKILIQRWRREYNTFRPHSDLLGRDLRAGEISRLHRSTVREQIGRIHLCRGCSRGCRCSERPANA